MIRDTPYIRANNLIGLEEFLVPYGGDIREHMRELGIPLSALTKVDSLISFRAFAALYETLSTRYDIPDFGLLLAQYHSPNYVDLGPTLLMSKFVSTIGEWIDMAVKFWHFQTNGFGFQLIAPETADQVTLRVLFNGLTLPTRQVTERTVANAVGLTRVVGGLPDENPIVIRFQHRKPHDVSEHEKCFRCPIEFGSDHIEIVFDRKFLSHPTTGTLKLLRPLMRLYVGERIRRMHLFDQSVTSTVAMVIPSLMGSGQCSIETASEALGINTKTLQRQLAKENTNFSELFEQVREVQARYLLAETKAPISRIAGMLDYSGSAPFSSAFVRWTDSTPLKYRQAHGNFTVNS